MPWFIEKSQKPKSEAAKRKEREAGLTRRMRAKRFSAFIPVDGNQGGLPVPGEGLCVTRKEAL